METAEACTGYRIWAVDNVVYGPVGLEALVEWARDERVSPETWVYCEQRSQWQPAAKVPALHAIFEERRQAAAEDEGDTEPFSPLIPGIRPGALRRVKILADMTDQQLGRFAQMMEVQNVRQWTVIVRQNTAGDSMYLVLEGEVRVRIMIGDKETILTTLGPGDFFGETALFDQGLRSADVVANKDSVVLRIGAESFGRLLEDSPDLATPFLFAIGKTLVARIRADNKRYRDSIAFARAAH